MNNCGIPIRPLCLVCNFPPCNCTKCKLLRCQGKPDREGITCAETNDPNSCMDNCCEEFGIKVSGCGQSNDGKIQDNESESNSNLTKSSTSLNFNSILFDIVCITS